MSRPLVSRVPARALLALSWLAQSGCGPLRSHQVDQAPPKGDPPQAPGEPAPTGQIWEDIYTEDACGKQSIDWILVDEMCGALQDPH